MERSHRYDQSGIRSHTFKRLLSLDILRGITIAFMIMVNNNGGQSAWALMRTCMERSYGNRPRVPYFLFVVGASVYLPMKRGWPREQEERSRPVTP